VILITASFGIPRDITPMIDFKLTVLPLYSKFTSASNLLAACTNVVAGRAWIPESATTVNCFSAMTINLLLFT